MAKNFLYEFAVWEPLRAVIRNNANTELAAIDSSLEQFFTFDTPTALVSTDSPAVYLDWEDCALQKSDDDSHCTQEHRFRADVVVFGNDFRALDAKASQYLLAINRALDKMTVADFADTSATLSGIAWEVTARSDAGFTRNQTTGLFRRDANLILVIQFMEVTS